MNCLRSLTSLIFSGIVSWVPLAMANDGTDLPFRITDSIRASDFSFPMRHQPLLSANFGELRGNHFHAGLDFKTEEEEGKPVFPAADGWISRIGITTGGYGKALYIDHPNGYTTIYGHLSNLAPRLDSILKAAQYEKESYVIQLYFEPGKIPVSKEEVVAYSGNTGGSGGPHLHFEVRDTKSEDPIDPLFWFSDGLTDDVKPRIYGMAIYTKTGAGVLSTRQSALSAQPIPSGSTKVEVTDTMSLPAAWGRIGLGFRVLDFMTGTTHNYGVCRATLSVDSQVVYQREMNRIPFDEARYINAAADYGEWSLHRKWYMKTFRSPFNRAGIYSVLVNDGYIDINEERPYHFCYEVADRFGNTSSWTFSIRGCRMPFASPDTTALLLFPGHTNEVIRSDFQAAIDKNALYDTVPLLFVQTPETSTVNGMYSDRYCLIGNHVACHTSVSMRMRIRHDILPEKNRYYVATLENDGSYSYEGGRYEDSCMKIETRHFGTFVVLADTVAPKISMRDVGFAMKNAFLRIWISDDASGIASYDVYLDGKWALAEDDYKNRSIFYQPDPVRFPSTGGEHVIKVIVRDNCGNERILERTFIY